VTLELKDIELVLKTAADSVTPLPFGGLRMTGSSPPSQRAETIWIGPLYRWALGKMQAFRGTSEHHEPRCFSARCRQYLGR
jgi:hypothetical protein